MSYTPRHDIPRSYVPTPSTSGSTGARGGTGGGLTPSSGLVMGSGTGLGMYPRVAHPISSAPVSTGSAAPPASILPAGERRRPSSYLLAVLSQSLTSLHPGSLLFIESPGSSSGEWQQVYCIQTILQFAWSNVLQLGQDCLS